MPQRKAAVKELRKNYKRHMHNLDIKTDLKKTTKSFLASVQKKDVAQAQSNLKLMYKKLDKAMKRNLIHRNTAARRKSRFSRLVTGLSSPKA